MRNTLSPASPTLHGWSSLCLFLLATAAPAQKTWFVDASGNGDFRDLPAAVATARRGDTIRVRNGIYNGAVISKALTILGEPGARIYTPPSKAALHIVNIPKDHYCVLKGLHAPGGLASGTFLKIENCVGHVHCDRLSAELRAPAWPGGTPAEVSNCAHVTFHQCRLFGKLGVTINRSTVVLSNVTAAGQPGCRDSTCVRDAGPALRATDSTVQVIECQLTGGDGNAVGIRPAAAISSTRSVLTVAGSLASRIAAGSGTQARWAIEGFGGGVQHDPRVRLIPNGSASPIHPLLSARSLRSPAIVDAAGTRPGLPLKFDLIATNGDVAELYLSLPGYPWRLPIPDSGTIWIDPATLIVLGRVSIGASERASFTLPLPNLPGLRGTPIHLQAVAASIRGVRFSTPATVVLD